MRIISGEFRHRKLISPPDAATTRPIPDRVKEALFSLLRGWTEGAVVVDVFAGSGAIGLEAVSRGASRCVFFEKDRRIADLLQRNIDMLGCTDRCDVIRADALGTALLTRSPREVDLMFFDPPYAIVEDPEGWDRVKLQFSRAGGLMKDKSFAVLRTPWPFRHRIRDAAVIEEEPRSSRSSRRGERDEEEEEKIWEGEDLRELEESGYAAAMGDDDGGDEGDEDEDGAEGAWAEDETMGRFEAVSLAIPGMQGPETHVYGSTAIHLYMKLPVA
jgi:16S rRNA (guanine966-N2)-methyltransferase